MRNVSDMEVFVRTVRCGSLSAAGRMLDLTPAAVSYRINKLEDSIGTRLLHRTTRRVTLTEDGAEYLRHVERLIGDLEQAAATVSRNGDVPKGTLKVTLPSSFGRQHISPIIPRFLKRHPELRINLLMCDDIVDIIGQGIDVAIRISELESSDFIARKVAPDRRIVCASPDYLSQHGTPEVPAQLSEHNCLVLTQQPYWTFSSEQGRQRVRVSGNFESNNGEAIRDAALAGLGIALKATWDIAGHVKSGRLRHILRDYPIASDTSVWAVYPSRRNVPAKVNAFIDFLREHFQSQPYWDTVP